MTDFAGLVYQIVSTIPKGKVATYGQIASKVNSLSVTGGRKVTPRQVGKILHLNPRPDRIPCHRVVFKDGSLSSSFAFGGIFGQKRKLLAEGVCFDKNGRVKLDVCLWTEK